MTVAEHMNFSLESFDVFSLSDRNSSKEIYTVIVTGNIEFVVSAHFLHQELTQQLDFSIVIDFLHISFAVPVAKKIYLWMYMPLTFDNEV